MTDTAAITSPASSYAALTRPVEDKAAKAKNAAQEFEGVFVSQMMSHMFEGTETDPMFGGGPGEDMFRSMMIQEVGKQMAKTQSIGLTAQMQKVMLQYQQH